MKTASAAQGGKVFDDTLEPEFDPAPGKEIDGARDDGLEMIPKPGFQQEQQGENDPERAEPTAHG